jgi:integrase
VRLFQKTLADKGLKPSTINDKPMKVLRMMLHQAYVDEIIPKNPALAVRRLPQGLTDVDPFTIEEREAIIDGFQRYAPLYANYVTCAFWTGWRPNEACAFRWPKVDFQQGKILIREGRVLGQTDIPKTTGSLRDIDMLPPVLQALMEQKALSWLLGGASSSWTPKTAAGAPGTLPYEGLGAAAQASGDPLPTALPDAAHLRHLCHLGRGKHQLGGPHAGAQKPGDHPGAVQPVCAESDPGGWQGALGGGRKGETFGPP